MRRIIISLALLSVAFLASADTSVSYTYNSLNRLIKVTYSNGVTVNYTYDALGNRTRRLVSVSSTGMRGDVDGDGKVNVADLSKLIDYLLSGDSSAINLANADMDGDGNVNIADVSGLIEYLLTLGK